MYINEHFDPHEGSEIIGIETRTVPKGIVLGAGLRAEYIYKIYHKNVAATADVRDRTYGPASVSDLPCTKFHMPDPNLRSANKPYGLSLSGKVVKEIASNSNTA